MRITVRKDIRAQSVLYCAWLDLLGKKKYVCSAFSGSSSYFSLGQIIMAKLRLPSVRAIFGLTAALSLLAPSLSAKAASAPSNYTLSDIAQFSGSNQLQTPCVPTPDGVGGFFVPLLHGGPQGAGGIVHITPAKKGWNAPQTIYSFSLSINGANPNTLFKDKQGNLYGTLTTLQFL